MEKSLQEEMEEEISGKNQDPNDDSAGESENEEVDSRYAELENLKKTFHEIEVEASATQEERYTESDFKSAEAAAKAKLVNMKKSLIEEEELEEEAQANVKKEIAGTQANPTSDPSAQAEMEVETGSIGSPRSFYTQMYEQKYRLGSGGFGNIFACLHKIDGKTYALKVIPYASFEAEDTLRECIIMATLEHPNIVRYYNSWVEAGVPFVLDGRRETSASDDEEKPNKTLYISMEKCAGTLRERLSQPFSSEVVEKILKELLEGLKFISTKNIVHRDICPDNIFVDDNGTPKLGDFGLATFLEGGSIRCEERVGRPGYFAPEVHAEGIYSSASDLYSLGISMMELIYPKDTVHEKDRFLTALKEGKFPEIDPRVNEDTINLIRNMLRPEAPSRAIVLDILG